MHHMPSHGPVETWLLASKPSPTHVPTPAESETARHLMGRQRKAASIGASSRSSPRHALRSAVTRLAAVIVHPTVPS
jgi:hypothetical protein